MCAHELGHHFLHKKIASTNYIFRDFSLDTIDEQIEYEANLFAAHLLLRKSKKDFPVKISLEDIVFELSQDSRL